MMHGGNIRIYSVLFPLCSSPVQAEDAFGPAIVRTWRTRVQGRTEWIRQVFRLVPPFPAFPVVNQWRAGETVFVETYGGGSAPDLNGIPC
jgi:hypothetical protein